MTSTLPSSPQKAQIVQDRTGWEDLSTQPSPGSGCGNPVYLSLVPTFNPLLPRHGPQNDHQISTRVTWVWLPCRRSQREGGLLAGPRGTGSPAPMPPAQRAGWPLWAPEAPVGLPRGLKSKAQRGRPLGLGQHPAWWVEGPAGANPAA